MDEATAESELQLLLATPSYERLFNIERNRRLIEDAPTAIEALSHAIALVEKFSKTMKSDVEASPETILRLINSIKSNRFPIGEGGDAWVVVHKDERREGTDELCYKLFKREATPRGRNTAKMEKELQSEVYTLLANTDIRIKAPAPLYSVEIGSEKMIAMERLRALSIDDLVRGKGTLPDWIDIEVFCTELKRALDTMHEAGIYHRDMHLGNVMVAQTKSDEGGPIGYIIDFGLTGKSPLEDFAYKKEVAGEVFTYNNDYGIIDEVRSKLNALRRRYAT